MNPEILNRLKQFESEGRMLEQQVNHLIAQKSTQKDFGDVVVSLIGSELLPHGTRGTGRKIAGKYFSNEMERAKKNAAYTADRWIGNITNYLNQVSRVTTSVTVKGNSHSLISKFNSAKKAVRAETKISRGLKALGELQKYDLVYNKELKSIIEERKMISAKSKNTKIWLGRRRIF